ncbi:PGPGW domain-containing protein [Arthrobacter castelli]|uniref:PGPGW domain-containing protein n=1 Tax=Arthrobacter castelli TaxID=271431 RepID=UPI000685387B|nr:PGPGW domain-containing protein [Arthrobacter castelli]
MRKSHPAGWLRRIGLETLGWTLVVLGLAALVLPGPGLLTVVAGLAVLSQQYVWAERKLHPIKVIAYRAAHEGVQTWPRIAIGFLGVVWITGLGIFWGLHPPVPDWWPLSDTWWLPGGWGTGSTMIGSGIIAFALIIYSIRRFRGKQDPDPAAPKVADPTERR